MTSSDLWNNKRIKEILTQTNQYSAKMISQCDLMIKSVFFQAIQDFSFPVLAVHVRCCRNQAIR